MTTALAAALVAMAARLSTHRDAAEVAARADELRVGALDLADADGAAYSEVIAAIRLPRVPELERRLAIERALEAAAAVPLLLAGIARELAERAAVLVIFGNPNLRGDAATAALLAAGAARASAVLVEIDLAHLPGGAGSSGEGSCPSPRSAPLNRPCPPRRPRRSQMGAAAKHRCDPPCPSSTTRERPRPERLNWPQRKGAT